MLVVLDHPKSSHVVLDVRQIPADRQCLDPYGDLCRYRALVGRISSQLRAELEEREDVVAIASRNARSPPAECAGLTVISCRLRKRIQAAPTAKPSYVLLLVLISSILCLDQAAGRRRASSFRALQRDVPEPLRVQRVDRERR
jgi:hypothetical protein